jgi:hypothetical protein
MANAGFFNENEYRQYPFIDKPDVRQARIEAGLFNLPEGLVVGCGFIMGIDSKFDFATDSVYLATLEVGAAEYRFTFKTTAAGAVNVPLIFTITRNSENNYEQWVTDYQQTAAATADCATEPLWEGFLVSGNLQEAEVPVGIYNFVPIENDVVPHEVEPGTIQSLVNGYLRSIGVGNYARTVIPNCPDEESSSSSSTAESRDVIPQATCLKGDIQFVAGVNCTVAQTDITNTITIGALLGANANTTTAGELCENYGELPLYDGEAPPAGSQFLSGGPACNELITSINGLGGPNVLIIAGAGLIINSEDNKLVLNISDTVISTEC